MERSDFHHALKILPDVCIGCSHCMRACPTEALRLVNGKATLIASRCIDCGECHRVCPTHAITVEQDDFNLIFNFKHRVALVPSVLFGQFPEDISMGQVVQALLNIGFTSVVEVEDSVEYLEGRIRSYIAENTKRPLISTFCPAVVRLVQVKFPSLVDNLILLHPPLDLTAIYLRRKMLREGINSAELGLFYVTPCAAKIAAIKSPVGDRDSVIDGVVNMDTVYNRILTEIRRGVDVTAQATLDSDITPKGIRWSLTNGEASAIGGSSMAVDGIENVIEFLEMVENGEIKGVDFLELRACDESCAGGVLTVGNRFLAAQQLHRRASAIAVYSQKKIMRKAAEHASLLHDHDRLSPIEPRSMLKLDEDMVEAVRKMERVNRIMCYLPGIDCGVCGAPSCLALAQDIVQGRAAISHCVFLQKVMEQIKLHPNHSFRIMKKIWGEDRFSKNCDKPVKR